MDSTWTPFDSIEATAASIRRGELSAVEVVTQALSQIERLNQRYNVLLTVSNTALEHATAVQRRVEAGKPTGPLAGVPFSVKDLIWTTEMPTTAGSRVFGQGLVADHDAALVKRLKEAGAIIVGKAHLHEFAYGVTNENSHYGPVRNPWDRERVSGGSSGGSAVSVATGMCLGSIGTDTRGSIRIPSAFCGLSGLKPTRGAVPLEGVIPLSWTLDHAGPIARRVSDLAVLFEILSSGSAIDTSPSAISGSGGPTLGPDAPTGHTLGICDYFWKQLDGEVEQPLHAALELFEQGGFAVREVGIPCIDEALEASRILAAADALAFHRKRLRENPQGYDPLVRERMLQGEAIRGVEVAEAFQLRRRLIEDFAQAFQQVDCLLGATVPCPPPTIGAGQVIINGQPAPTVETLVRLNAPQNVAGVPALALPCGFSSQNLPVSMQLVAAAGKESILFEIGAWYQQQTDWHLRRAV